MSEALVRGEGLTAEEFYDLYAGTDHRVELAHGEVIEMPPVNAQHGEIDCSLSHALFSHVRAHGLGKVLLNTGFVLRRTPGLVRAPDQAFVSAERARESPPPERGFWPIAPDLVVEIVSPDDRADEINQKVREYLDAGVRLIWVVYPRQRQVHVYGPSGDVRILFAGDTLDGEGVVPGFRVALGDIWVSEGSDEQPAR